MLNTRVEPPKTVIAKDTAMISILGININVLYVKKEKFTTNTVEIMMLKKVLLSLRNLEENRLKASIIKEMLIDTKKFISIEFRMNKIVRKTPIRERK
ncbi:MAG: hypothetical protein ACTSSC_07370 [Promethearchaeota archaeon]